MRIQFRSTKSVKEVRDKIGQTLIDRGFARLYETREIRAAQPPATSPSKSVHAPYGLKKDGTPKKAPGRTVTK